MKRKFLISLTIFALTALFFSGCSELLQVLQPLNVQKPKVQVANVKLKALNFTKADLLFNLKIENPNALSVSLHGFDYDFLINKNSFVKGQQETKTQIKPNGVSIVPIPVTLSFKKLYQTYRSLNDADSLHYTLKAGFTFALPVLGNVRIPVTTSGKLPTVTLPRIAIQTLKLENLGFTQATLRLQLRLNNPNAWSAILQKLNYRFAVNGNQWATGNLEQKQQIAGKQESLIDIPITLNLLQMGTTVYNVLTHPGALHYELKGGADFQSSIKLLGSFKVPLDQKGTIELVK